MERSHDECRFCVIDETVLMENEHANLLMSNPRKVEAHLLAIPKRHIEIPWETTEKELVAIFGLIRVAQKKLTETYGGGVDIRQHFRPYVPQGRIKVDHLHYHIIPREEGDDFYRLSEKSEYVLYEYLTEEEITRVERLFRSEERQE